MAFFDFGYKKKLEEIKTYLETGRYEDAALAADQIPEYKIRSAYELNLIGKAYKYNKDFLQARENFERSYEVRTSRTVLMDIMDCCLAMKDLQAVEQYFDEYHKVAPEDKVTLYKYRYRIEKKKGRARHLLIPILEELKALEYIEEYAYELAKQYHKAGMVQECMNECHDIILWFGFGPTVERAKALLAYYKGEISPEEMKSAREKFREENRSKETPSAWKEELQDEEEEAAPTKEVSNPTALELETTSKSVYGEIFGTKMPAESRLEELPNTSQMSEFIPREWQREQAMSEPEAEELPRRRAMSEPEMEEVPRRAMSEAEMEEVPRRAMSEPEMEEVPGRAMSEPEAENFQDREAMPEVAPKVQWTEPELAAQQEIYVPEPEPEAEIQDEHLKQLLQKSPYSVSEVLKNFGRMDRIRRQVIKGLELAVNDRERTYFVITGEPQTGKTTLAFRIIHLLYEMGVIPYDRTATLDALQLNQISLRDYEKELCNCNLVIEHAGSMTEASLDGLLAFSEERKGKICVILEDSVRDINKSLRSRKELNSLFINRIHIGKYSPEELFGFAYDSIRKEDYKIEKQAARLLENKIAEIVYHYDIDQQLLRTLELVGRAIAHAEERTKKQLLSMAAEGKIVDGTDMILQKEDI